MNIKVNYHSSIKIEDIYIDPFNINDSVNDAKYIFITHCHYDHYSVDDIKKIINEDTVFVCTKDVAKELNDIYKNKIIVVEPNHLYSVENFRFSTFASYNINKDFHPLNKGWVGYVIEISGLRYAIIGDSDLTEEAKKIECDVLFVPIGGIYTMNAKEASELANIIKPKLVIPVHYNGIVGNKNDEKVFLNNLKNVPFEIHL